MWATGLLGIDAASCIPKLNSNHLARGRIWELCEKKVGTKPTKPPGLGSRL